MIMHNRMGGLKDELKKTLNDLADDQDSTSSSSTPSRADAGQGLARGNSKDIEKIPAWIEARRRAAAPAADAFENSRFRARPAPPTRFLSDRA